MRKETRCSIITQRLRVDEFEKLLSAPAPVRNKKRVARWTPELIQTEALKYKTRLDFAKGSVGAYRAATNLDILSDVCSHMPRDLKQVWSYEKIIAAAAKYKTRGDFRTQNEKAYNAARRYLILDEVCSHM